MDNLSKEERRRLMKNIGPKNSAIEMRLRRELWRRGLRYRLHHKKTLGRPDICFVSAKVAVFVDSEFWHGWNWDVKQQEIKSNRAFWVQKIESNIRRDHEVTAALRASGWSVVRIWGKRIARDAKGCADIVEREVEARASRKM